MKDNNNDNKTTGNSNSSSEKSDGKRKNTKLQNSFHSFWGVCIGRWKKRILLTAASLPSNADYHRDIQSFVVAIIKIYVHHSYEYVLDKSLFSAVNSQQFGLVVELSTFVFSIQRNYETPSLILLTLDCNAVKVIQLNQYIYLLQWLINTILEALDFVKMFFVVVFRKLCTTCVCVSVLHSMLSDWLMGFILVCNIQGYCFVCFTIDRSFEFEWHRFWVIYPQWIFFNFSTLLTTFSRKWFALISKKLHCTKSIYKSSLKRSALVYERWIIFFLLPKMINILIDCVVMPYQTNQHKTNILSAKPDR